MNGVNNSEKAANAMKKAADSFDRLVVAVEGTLKIISRILENKFGIGEKYKY